MGVCCVPLCHPFGTRFSAFSAGNARSDDAVGRWKGSWSSGSTGHGGALRARIRKIDNNHYRALFAGRFAKVIPFIYPAKLTRIAGTNQFTSTQRLPIVGTYRMNASIGGGQFYAQFRGKKDVGVFQMRKR